MSRRKTIVAAALLSSSLILIQTAPSRVNAFTVHYSRGDEKAAQEVAVQDLEEKTINPQPEPPGKGKMINPQPEPPGKMKITTPQN